MKSIFVLKPDEDWIVDRICNEFVVNTCHDVSLKPFDAEIVWLVAPWCWNRVSTDFLASRKVVCSIHHIVPDKFLRGGLEEFKFRDNFITQYHVPCQQTYDFISQYTKKPIVKLGYWWNDNFWSGVFITDKKQIRTTLGIGQDEYVVGTFQRDTEGFDLKTPKLEKGPDLFCDYIDKLSQNTNKNIRVLLGGWRRQYIVSRLQRSKINYSYFELPTLDFIRNMYAACDLYVVSSRYEGGPQALFEASAMGIPIISTRVGMAEDCLVKGCIYDNLLDAGSDVAVVKDIVAFNRKKIDKYAMSTHVRAYDKMFDGVVL